MKTKAVIATFILSFFLFTAPVLAQGQGIGTRPTGTPVLKRQLTQERLRSCEARQEAIRTRMNSLLRMSTNMTEKFDATAQRVRNFYTNTVLPGGKSLSNYDALVADIDAKKAQVGTDLTAAQNQVGAFNCSGEDPKGNLNQFRVGMQGVKNGLKNYRVAIKNLIVAVRRLAPKGTSAPIPTPTTTP